MLPSPDVRDANVQIRVRVSETPMVSLHMRLPGGYPSRAYPRFEIVAPGLDGRARYELSTGKDKDRGMESPKLRKAS